MTDEQLIPLRRAAEIFLGDARHVATLRAEASRGNLVVSRIGRLLWTTLPALREMEAKCRVEARVQSSGTTRRAIDGRSATAKASAAQAAVAMRLEQRKKNSRTT